MLKTVTIGSRVAACLLTMLCPQAVALTAASENLHVAAISFVPVKWDKDANSTTIEHMVRQAAARGAQLIVTPEGALEGYVVNEVIRAENPQEKARLERRFQRLAEPLAGPYAMRFRQLADALDVYLVLGLLEADGRRTYNTAAIFGPDGRLVGKYRKTHFHQGYDVNPPGYTPGDRFPVFDLDGVKFGIMICFDRQPPEPARLLALGGADVILCPAYGSWGDWNTRLLQTRAYENDTHVVFVHPQQSLILDRRGNILEECREGEIASYELDLRKPAKARQSVAQRRPALYGGLSRPIQTLD